MKRILLSLVTVLLGCFIQAQDRAGLWTGISLEKNLTKKIEAGLDLQYRLENNLKTTDNYFAAIAVGYRVDKSLKVTGYYRYIRQPIFNDAHRIYADARLDISRLYNKVFEPNKRWKRLSVDYRLRIQKQISERSYDTDAIRNKLSFKYNLKSSPVNPYITGELFVRLNDRITYSYTEVNSYTRANKYRFKLGADVRLAKKSSINGFYLMQQSFESKIMEHVLGVIYTYNI